MNTDERICSMALTLCPGIGHINGKRLVDELGSARAVFEQRTELPALLPGFSQRLTQSLDCPDAFARAERELELAEKNHITCLTLKDEAYPSRLRECEDAPLLLFFKGDTDFNRLHVVSMVGTRHATEYGKAFCERFVRDLSELQPDVLVVSGLAYGIDIHAHRAALKHGLHTVGVLAHGLDRIYPHVHRKTAVDMIAQGGLLTEYPSDTNPDRRNFVSRNRIVAGMADATVVVESSDKGGSLITASLANSYGRDCFALPGRVGDEHSVGCNRLIRDQRAQLVTSAGDLVNAMGWTPRPHPEAVQRNLFPDLDPEEQHIIDLLQQEGDLHINTLMVLSDIPINRLAALLFNLEMKGMVKPMAGGAYRMV